MLHGIQKLSALYTLCTCACSHPAKRNNALGSGCTRPRHTYTQRHSQTFTPYIITASQHYTKAQRPPTKRNQTKPSLSAGARPRRGENRMALDSTHTTCRAAGWRRSPLQKPLAPCCQGAVQ